jgi:DNA-binding MurR/RpiR family transcriptional regulator
MLRSIPVDSSSALIAAVGDDLTPTERRIASAVLDDPTLLAFGTVADLARKVGTSRPSVVRFAVKLGFDGYTELQDSIREGLSQQLFRPSDRIRHDEDASASSATSATSSRDVMNDAVSAVFDALAADRLAALGDPIANATAVWIFTGETSRAGASTLLSGLSIVRPHVQLVEEHSVGTALASAAPTDVGVVFDFYRYRQHAVDTALGFSDAGVAIVAITDGPLSPLAQLTDTWVGINVPAIGPFDSSVPAVTAAELLVAHVANKLHTGATARIDRTETMWAATGTFTDS